ncbi:MAG: ATP-binding protein [Acidiferrobacterales bacterium]
MDRATLTRYATGITPLAVLSVVLLAAVYMMDVATHTSTLSARLYAIMLVIIVFGILLMLIMITANLYRLATQLRARVMGSRLTLRLLGMFVLLTIIPVSVVLVFSLQAVNKGIDSWFDVRTEKALDDALLVGRSALDAIKRDLVNAAKEMTVELEDVPDKLALPTLEFLREKYGILELTLFSQDGTIIASSSGVGPETGTLVPDQPSNTVLSQIRHGEIYANLDPIGRADLQLRIVAPVPAREVGTPIRILQLLQPLPTRYAALGQSVQSAFAEYEKLVYLRGPLKFGFTLTLGLVAALTMLISVSAAIFSARRLVAPIRDLAAGTRAVAQGDYHKQLPVTRRDEFGILVKSFNDMTHKIQNAQDQIKRSQAEAEVQRAYLETVLTHLSSGVLSLDQRDRLRTYNSAAVQILGVDLEPTEGKSLARLAKTFPELFGFCQTIRDGIASGKNEWQAEVNLSGLSRRRALLLRGTMLPKLRRRKGGHVIVFDDVTALIQAERDAAWREVARRLAHEIKNPLTPIQLSAERIRHKCMYQLPDVEKETMDRATRTIVEQVEALKSMVNAFSDYARTVQMQAKSMNLNHLVRDVVELYDGAGSTPLRKVGRSAEVAQYSKQASSRAAAIALELDPKLPMITADPGRLRQVLHNLFLNAREALASHNKPQIRVRTRSIDEQRFVELIVEDNGPGFPQSVLDNLFEPYVTTNEKGTGLGLAIVKKVVEEHSGVIVAENTAEGGARVRIRLPRGAAEESSRRAGRTRVLREKRA